MVTPVTVFDTNAYRELSDQRLDAIVQAERQQGVRPLACAWVVIELVARLAAPNDPAFPRARAALRRLWRHCAATEEGHTVLPLVADSEAQLARTLFGYTPPDRAEETTGYAQLVHEVTTKTPSDWILGPRVLPQFAAHVADVERTFVTTVNAALAAHAPGTSFDSTVGAPVTVAGSLGAKQDQQAAFLAFLDTDASLLNLAEAVVTKAAMIAYMVPDPSILKSKVDQVMACFRTPLELYREVCRKVVRDKLNLKKYANWAWDIEIAYLASPLGRLDGRPVWLVTSDNEIVAAAARAGAGECFKTLRTYEETLGAV